MSKNKFQLLIITWLSFITAFMFIYGFGNGADKSVSIGYNARITETDTNLVIAYGDTNRIVISRANHTVTFGSSTAAPTESIAATCFEGLDGISSLDQLWVHASSGVTEDFYVEGNTLLTGYTDTDSLTSNLFSMNTNSGITPIALKCGIYFKTPYLIFCYNDGAGTNFYYYADVTAASNITQLTYSATEP